MRIVFAGSGDFAVPILDSLIGSAQEIALVVTQAARPAGRGRRLSATPVALAAARMNLPVETPRSLADCEPSLRALAPDVLVVVDYGRIVPAAVLAAARHGGLNVHPSLLPRWRGAAPVARAIEAGDRDTGVAIMQMDAGLDTGAILALERSAIGAEETAGELEARLAQRGAALLLATLDTLGTSATRATAQRGEASYAAKVLVREARLDFSEPAERLARRVRAFNPRPGAWAECAGERLRLLRARPRAGSLAAAPGTIVATQATGLAIATGEGLLEVTELQRPGRRIQSAATLCGDERWIGRVLC
ncbi:MAG TPA: methionyl-tRNA formyltransferase [Gammaproteobacteria bacterium]|nr:methionyl-tRNA formyltransferase [Gammaproteobacteria bacterium]